MNKSIKIIISIIMALIVLWGVIFLIDYFRCANFKVPIFVLKEEISDDGSYETYYGLGYKVIVENIILEKDDESFQKIQEELKMYLFNNFVMGAIAEIDSNIFIAKEETDFELKTIQSEEKEVEKITTDELDEKYDYDIYYYGLESVTIKINNTEIDLKEALLKDKITMEQIIEKAEEDSKNEIIRSGMYKDGGTMIYHYDTYTIIKSYSLDGNRDVYIGIPEMGLNQVR